MTLGLILGLIITAGVIVWVGWVIYGRT